jgi:multiple sugar transport system permease protein
MTEITDRPPRLRPKPPQTGAGRRRTAGSLRRSAGRNLSAYGFLVAALACFAMFSWYPMVREFMLAFQHVNYVGASTWVGFANFRHLFADPQFGAAWRNTAEFTGFALVIGYLVPFGTAVLLNELRHARGYLRMIVFLPVMLPPAVAVLLFKWFYDPGPGLFNDVLRTVHLPTLQWLDSSNTALLSLVIVSTWMNMGSATLIYLAALQTIPGELYEAAELDGAGLWRKIRHITIPQTKLVLLIMLLMQVIATMQVFVEPYMLTGGGPGNSTVTVVLLVYKYAFNYNNYGGGAALGLMLLVILLVFSGGYLRVTRDRP